MITKNKVKKIFCIVGYSGEVLFNLLYKMLNVSYLYKDLLYKNPCRA